MILKLLVNVIKFLKDFNEEDITDNITMLKPHRVYIGVQNVDEDEEPVLSENGLHDAQINTQFEDELENGNIETEHPITITIDGTEMYSYLLVDIQWYRYQKVSVVKVCESKR